MNLNSINIKFLIIDDISYSLYLPAHQQDYIQKKIYEEGKPYEYEMLKYIINHTEKNSIIIDIGANIGNHTIYLAKKGYTLYSFEPNKELYDLLNINVKINSLEDKIKTFQLALGKNKTKAKFKEKIPNNLGSQSLEILKDGNIEVLPLDSFDFSNIGVIKIDVEGMELDVLKGAFQTIKKHRPDLYIECIDINSFKKIYTFLEEISYVYFDTFNATPTHRFIFKEKLNEKELINKSNLIQINESYRMTQQLNLSKRIHSNVSKAINMLENFSIKEINSFKNEINDLKQKNIEYIQQTESLKSEKKFLKKEIENLNYENYRLKEEINSHQQKNIEYLKQIETISTNLEKMTQNFKGMDARNKKLILENEKLKQEISELKEIASKHKTNFIGMDARNKKLQKEMELKQESIESLKNSLSFRFGNLLIRSAKNPLKIFTLPYYFYNEYKQWKQWRINKTIKKEKKNIINIKPHNNELKICVIMDDFTFLSFKDEANLFMLSLSKWQEEINSVSPDFIFIESAWKGNRGVWEKKISNCSNEFKELINFAKDKSIPTIFWNKEDPVHFDTFIKAAKMCDIVFTTDIDSIARYKKAGVTKAYYLPFAAQPSIHNPIEKFERKDKVNFAGSYYLRYPERQIDFENIINAVSSFKKIEIYDRNYDNPHPHYTFPERYQSMIIGKLPPEEIEKAYKGYRYGINMNTIKYSQSMFARRVYELLASNTIVISNFSRGMRYLFGDLVISSDNEISLKERLFKIVQDDFYYKKLRLLGLRKVLQEHTYADRLNYIVNKLDFSKNDNSVFIKVIAYANSQESFDSIIKNYKRQSYQKKHLYIVSTLSLYANEHDITIVSDIEKLYKEIKKSNKQVVYIAYFDSKDYYGTNYLLDMALATKFYKSGIIGKCSYYTCNSNGIEYQGDKTYRISHNFSWRRSIVPAEMVEKNDFEKIMNNHSYVFSKKGLSIDEFSYCENAATINEKKISHVVDDLEIYTGSKLKKLYTISEKMPALSKEEIIKTDFVELDSQELYQLIKGNKKIQLSLKNDLLHIKFNVEKHTYIYARKTFQREELNLLLNSEYEFKCKEIQGDIRGVFIFLDEKKEKISHSITPLDGKYSLAIPNECKYVRLGLRVEGKGNALIKSLQIGKRLLTPQQIIPKSDTLVLTKQYPSYDDLYKYGFLHTRLKAYKKEHLEVDVFRIGIEENAIPYREFENIDVASFPLNYDLLDRTLQSGQIKKILVHLLDDKMWNILEKYIDKIKIFVWVHGAEIQPWHRRSFEFENMNEQEIIRKKKLSNHRMKFWKKILKNPHPNLKLIFVSQYFADEVMEDLGFELPKSSYTIIHNYIDTNLFNYKEKGTEQRKKVLSIRPYASRKYANDLSVKAVLYIKEKYPEIFKDLEFRFIGDGALFDETLEPIKKLENVIIEKKFLTQKEIANLHKDYGVFLVPTRMDSQGVSRDEAMSSGLVPITNRVAAIPEFVDERCGILADPEDYIGLAEGIVKLYNNPKLFLHMSKNAAERVSKQSGYEQTILKEIRLIKA